MSAILKQPFHCSCGALFVVYSHLPFDGSNAIKPVLCPKCRKAYPVPGNLLRVSFRIRCTCGRYCSVDLEGTDHTQDLFCEGCKTNLLDNGHFVQPAGEAASQA